MSGRRAVRVALPGMDAAVTGCAARGDLPRLPAAEWLLARGERGPAPASDWRAWLLAGAGLGDDVLERFPAGPCSRFAWTGQRCAGTWACAAPVHLHTALDHLQLAAPVPLPLTTEEDAALRTALNAHLAGTGFRLEGCDGGGWLLECPAPLACTAGAPAEAIGCNLRERLPEGPDAGRVRALVNDLQMLLHEHPVNLARESRGLPAVNSVWLWGFGRTPAGQGTPTAALVTDDPWLTGLWRLHGGEVRAVAALANALDTGPGRLLVGVEPRVDGSPADVELRALEREVGGPLQAALQARRVERVDLLAGASVVTVHARARRWFWCRSRPLTELLQ